MKSCPKKFAIYAVAVSAIALTATQTARAAVITVDNPSFEIVSGPSGGGWYSLYNGVGAIGWTVAGSDYAVNEAPSEHFVSVPDGNRVLNLVAVNPSQVLDFTPVHLDNTVHIGDQITMSYYMGLSLNPIYPTGTGTANIYAGVTLIGTQNFDVSSLTPGTFSLQTLYVASASATGTLKIEFVATAGTPWIDAVSVTASAIPEPSTWGFLAFGLTSLLIFRRRRLA